MEQAAFIVGDWEFHLLGKHLYITSERDAEVQIQLTAKEALGLLNYLSGYRRELGAVLGIEPVEMPFCRTAEDWHTAS